MSPGYDTAPTLNLNPPTLISPGYDTAPTRNLSTGPNPGPAQAADTTSFTFKDVDEDEIRLCRLGLRDVEVHATGD